MLPLGIYFPQSPDHGTHSPRQIIYNLTKPNKLPEIISVTIINHQAK